MTIIPEKKSTAVAPGILSSLPVICNMDLRLCWIMFCKIWCGLRSSMDKLFLTLGHSKIEWWKLFEYFSKY
jgi:hypothetical protein